LSYDGYAWAGDLNEIGEVTRRAWDQTGELGEDIDLLRAVLFREQRSSRWAGGGLFGQRVPFDREPFVVALVARIRRLSGGSVDRRSDYR
jgi:hypothetical protein